MSHRPELLRYGAVLRWVTELGLNRIEFDKLVRVGAITPIRLHQGGRAYYSRVEIEAVIVAPLRAVASKYSKPETP